MVALFGGFLLEADNGMIVNGWCDGLLGGGVGSWCWENATDW